MKRLRLRIAVLLIVLGALLASVGVAYLFSQRRVVIGVDLYDRFQIGMTEAEVDAAAPIPAGDYADSYAYITEAPTRQGEMPGFGDYSPHADGTVSAPHPVSGRTMRGKWWRGEEGQVLVFFGDDRRVIERRYYPGRARSWLAFHWDRIVR